jgi:hypothetical protein
MSKESRILLENITSEAADSGFSYGEKKVSAGYYRKHDTLTTVVYDVNEFVGSIKIQGTLEIYPGETDWIDINNTIVGNGEDSSVWASTPSVSFTGNWVWIRAAYNLQNGTITQVRYNY